MEIDLPLISPLSRKYYQYANDAHEKIHHRMVDIRVCLEKVCDSIIIQLVSPERRDNWHRYQLHNKIEACRDFMDSAMVDNILRIKGIGNSGAHEGEESIYTSEDVENSLNVIKDFSLEIMSSFFIQNGFENNSYGTSWIPTVFSTLPPIYRVEILKKYYSVNHSLFIIDKLSKAYIKSGMKKEGFEFLDDCFLKKELDYEQIIFLKSGMELLEKNLSLLSVAQNLEEAKENFNRLLPAIKEDERDVFVCLVSMILTGDIVE